MSDTHDPKARAQLYKKLAAVTAAVSRIPKNGKNTFHNYKYATESDITDGLRDLMNEHGLAFLPPSVIAWERDPEPVGKGGYLTRVQVQFGLACTDTGEVFTSMLWGEGQDGGDKGFYKAYTGAVKYFLMKTFLIATGDDPEQDSHQPRQEARQQPAQQARTQDPKPAPRTDDQLPPHVIAGKKYFDKYQDVVGGRTWKLAAAFLQSNAPAPTTVDGWKNVERATEERLAARKQRANGTRLDDLEADFDEIDAATPQR